MTKGSLNVCIKLKRCLNKSLKSVIKEFAETLESGSLKTLCLHNTLDQPLLPSKERSLEEKGETHQQRAGGGK